MLPDPSLTVGPRIGAGSTTEHRTPCVRVRRGTRESLPVRRYTAGMIWNCFPVRAALAVAALALGLLPSVARAADLYVSPAGNDAWTGRLAEADAQTSDGPFATLEKARDAARKLRAGGEKGAVTIHLRAGVYALPKGLQLGKEDSGLAGAPTTWRGFRDERPVLIGGRTVTDFRPHRGAILKADLAAQGLASASFKQVIFDGARQHLARYPNFDPKNPYGGGFAYADGKPVPMYADVPGEDRRTLRYAEADARIGTWARPQEAEVFVFPRYNWWNNIVRVASVDKEGRTVKLVGDCSYPIRPGDRYYLQNAFEDLDAPGEWYLDRKANALYFWPPEERTTKPRSNGAEKGIVVYVPTTRQILEVGAGAHDITIRGLTFECCEGTAVALNNATDCLVAGNVIRNVGDYHGSGVSVTSGSNVRVAGNDISYTGSNGVSLSGGDRVRLAAANLVAENNYIHHVGVFYKQGVGVAVHGCGNRVSHNLIHDGPRMGIIFSGQNHVFEYNHVRHINLETEDTGAIYTGGRDWLGSRGCVIRYNYFHDSLGYGRTDGKWVSPHFSWGVYLDDNTGGVDVIGNIVVRAHRGPVHLHNGRDNLVENNVLVGGEIAQIECNGWTPQHRYWVNHLPSMIKGYESVKDQPAWKAMRNMGLHPKDAVLPDNTIMSGNVFRRNVIVCTNPKSKAFKVNAFSFTANQSDQNLVWAMGQPVLTGQYAVKSVSGANLVGNPSFEEGEPGKLPAGWKWQQHAGDAKATLDDSVAADGRRSLKVEARTAADAKGTKQTPILVSDPIAAKPGQVYRLTARVRATDAKTKVGIALQSYVSKVYFWYKEKSVAAAPQWQEVELVCALPGPGEKGYHEAMKVMQFRIDVRGEAGDAWVDSLTLHEAQGLDEWESWKTKGADKNSIVADPQFVDPARDDYRLRETSPAWALGFKPIPVEKIGPYRDELRATWPIAEAAGARETPLVSGK